MTLREDDTDAREAGSRPRVVVVGGGFAAGVRLTTGEEIATRTLVWCVGVRPDPLVTGLGLPTERGRLVVDERLAVPGHPEVLACGDAAAVPDPTRPGELTTMTAQHAERRGRLAGHNVAASLGHGRPGRYGRPHPRSHLAMT